MAQLINWAAGSAIAVISAAAAGGALALVALGGDRTRVVVIGVLAVALAAVGLGRGHTNAASGQPAVLVDGEYHVESVTDGDSLRLVGVTEAIRLIGIDAPEETAVRFGHAECLGTDAASYLETLLVDSAVIVELGRDPSDRYGRHLAYVWLPDGTFINESMVLAGLAYAVEYQPNTLYSDVFAAAERDAAANHRGVWGFCPRTERLD